MNKRTFIKDFSGIIRGSIDTDTKTGDQVAKNFAGKILGYYEKKRDITKSFSGTILAQGNILSSLILDDTRKGN